MPDVDAIEQHAARWVVRRNGAAPDALPDPGFAKWYGADQAHAQRYDSIAALWRQMGQVDGEALRQDVRQGQQQHRKRRAKLATVLSCSLIAAGALLWQTGAWWRWQADAVAAVGEIRSVTLADGSTVLLDSDSAIRSDMSGATRKISLLRGRARFTVAHDAQRPFVVETPQGRATALGTRYEVSRLRDGATEVSVLESRVRVDCSVCAPGTAPQVLSPAQRAAIGTSGVTVTAFDPGPASAWTERRLLLRDVPLAEAVAQLNRYTGMTTWIDEAAGKRRISSVVNVDSPDALSVLAAAANVRVRRWASWAWITPTE
nr:FecR domain-containing protein [uncultured Achromobacter sp.]